MSTALNSKIDAVKKERKDSLDLSSLHIEEIPEEIRELKWLKRLNLSFNLIEIIPDWLEELTLLENLDLRHNNLKSLFSGIKNLANLTSLNIRSNNLTEIPKELRHLKKLSYISIASNKVEKIPEWFFEMESVNLENNPIIDPPIEIYTSGMEAVKNYFYERSKGTENLYEAKLLIVGEPGAGKTTLMNKILDEKFVINPFEASTKGIEIKPFYFNTDDGNYFRINIWDFGGQEIYHATHQFFLTKRSLYLLLADNRAENTDFNYWLQTIELLSGSSPLLIVQNEKQDRKKDINESGMKERFKNIKNIVSLNLASDISNLKFLIREIQYQISRLSHIGAELPKIWVGIRNRLEEISKIRAYITEQEYLDVCAKFGMVEKERAFFLSDYLHDLGVFLHFKDNAILKRWIILRPDWGTEAVYKILDNETVISKNGYFDKRDLMLIWNQSLYSDMHDELISLMMRFELCYKIDGEDTYIAPQLLKTTKARYIWNDSDNLTVRYSYEFMPKGIVTRFIVRMHYHIKDQKLVWREGVILEREQTVSEITETYGAREIKIRIQGRNKKEFLAIILDAFDRIHMSYTNLKVSKLIPCNCGKCGIDGDPYYFQYDMLKKYYNNGIYEERCKDSLKLIKISSLIDDALGRVKDGVPSAASVLNIFISYSDEDLTFKNEFIKYLNSLGKNGAVTFFDKSNIPAGENEKKFIRDKIDTADFIILLISQSYLNSEWNYDVEMAKSLDRKETGSCGVIPVILKDCSWESSPLKVLKPVLFKRRPLFSDMAKMEEALTDAVYQIKSAVEVYMSDTQESLFNLEPQENEIDEKSE